MSATNSDRLEFWLQTNRWDLIKKTYGLNKAKPKSALARYALVKAYQNSASKSLPLPAKEMPWQYLQILLGNQSFSCAAKLKTEETFLNCLKREKIASTTNNGDKIVLLTAANISRQLKWYRLQLRILELISLENDFFHSKEILAPRMALMRNSQVSKTTMRQLINRYQKTIDYSAYGIYQRGFFKLSLQRRTEALQDWAHAFSRPDCENWLKKDIIRDLQKYFSGIFNQKEKKENIRLLTAFSSHLSKKQISSIRRIFPPAKILANPARKKHPFLLQGDGFFLIAVRRYHDFLKIVASNQQTLLQDTSLIIGWADHLLKNKQYGILLDMANKFPDLKNESIQYYRIILAAHEKKTKKLGLIYFEELLGFLNANPYAIAEHDKLIEFLVKRSRGKIQSYASFIYWKKAAKEIPQHHSSGRFYYWLARFYEAKKMHAEKDIVQKNVYRWAPGSYYTYAFLNGKVKRDTPGHRLQEKNLLKKAEKEWRQEVRSRTSYLQWLSKYGSLPVEKIARFKRSQFLDPKAVSVNIRIRKNRTKFSNPLILKLLQFGKWAEVLQTLKHSYYRKIPTEDYYIRMIRLGKQTGHLNIQVYYTKALLNEFKISVDPFSLPQQLLDLLYPQPYLRLVKKYTGKFALEPAVVYAIMRQESLFRPGAVSRSDARGLMQILPSTGRWLQKLLKLPTNNLFNPEYNIHLGSYYFSRLLKSYENNFDWAAIAYNGGPGNLSKWKAKHLKDDDFYLFLENLPASESRNYCRIVLKNYRDYQLLHAFY